MTGYIVLQSYGYIVVHTLVVETELWLYSSTYYGCRALNINSTTGYVGIQRLDDVSQQWNPNSRECYLKQSKTIQLVTIQGLHEGDQKN